MNTRKKLSEIFILMIITIFVIIIYRNLWNVYFQQDEWYTLGTVYSQGVFAVLKEYSFLQLLSGNVRPFGTFLNNFLHYNFPQDVRPFITIGLLFHIVNSYMVYKITQLIKIDRFISISSGFMYASMSQGHQALTWFASTTTTLPCAFFTLLTLYNYIQFLQHNNKKYLFYTVSFTIISSLFKESSIFLLIFIPIIWLVKNKPTIGNMWKFMRNFLSLYIYFAFVFIMRVMDLSGAAGKTGSFITSTLNPVFIALANLILYPLLGLSQMFFPWMILLRISSLIQSNVYSFLSETTMQSVILENITMDIVSLALSFILLCISGICIFRSKNSYFGIIIGFVFALLSFMPYTVLIRGSSYLDSRYYYIGIVGGVILYTSIVSSCLENFKLKNLNLYYFAYLVFSSVTLIYMYKNIRVTQRHLNTLAEISQDRLSILRSMDTIYASVKPNTVFFIDGNTQFYGIDGLKVPFQQNPGYTYMVWTRSKNRSNRTIINDIELLNLTYEGYKKYPDGASFGYYQHYDSLLRDYKSGLLGDEINLIALYYDGVTKKMADNTKGIRELIQHDLNSYIQP